MARVNFEDDVESRGEFRRLHKILGDDDMARGRLVRFFRLAQKAFAREEAVSESELTNHDLGCMIESGWAVPVEGGFVALGSEKQFAWYKQRVYAGKKRASSPRNSEGQFTSGTPADDQRKSIPHHRETIPDQPLTLSLTPSLTQNTNTPPNPPAGGRQDIPPRPPEETLAEVQQAIEEWGRTLAHYRRSRAPTLDQLQLARVVKANSLPRTLNAIRGFRGETRSGSYDPAKFVNVARLMDPNSFLHLEAIGEQITAGARPDASTGNLKRPEEDPDHWKIEAARIKAVEDAEIEREWNEKFGPKGVA